MNVVLVKYLGAAIESELHIVECPLSTDQLVVELDDAYEITAKVGLGFAGLWLRGFWDEVSDIRKVRIS